MLRAKPVDRAGAVDALDRALEVAPDPQVIARQAGSLYMTAQAYERGAAVLSTLPDRELLVDIGLGHCLLLSGDVDGGVAHLNQSLKAAVDARRLKQISEAVYAHCLNGVGYAFADANVHLDSARRLLIQADRHRPGDPAIIDSLGWVYYRMGDFRRSTFYLERAVRLSGDANSAEMYYHLGAAYAKTGRVRRAAEALLKALDHDPAYDPADKELRLLGLILPPPAEV